MEIKGFLKNSFVDWDGKIASVIFLPGCNFRCGFCYNVSLVLNPESIDSISLDTILEYLADNRKFIDGVVITGGEPTLQHDLPELILKIKSSGFPVKLDTNGTNPQAIKELLEKKLLDYIAMDIKAPFEKYERLAGTHVDIGRIKESIFIIMNSGIDYEFRTTVIPSMHIREDIESIAKEIAGAKKYALQKFVNKNETIDKRFMSETAPDDRYMQEMKKAAEKYVENVIVRE